MCFTLCILSTLDVTAEREIYIKKIIQLFLKEFSEVKFHKRSKPDCYG